jgi:hypothetical protein
MKPQHHSHKKKRKKERKNTWIKWKKIAKISTLGVFSDHNFPEIREKINKYLLISSIWSDLTTSSISSVPHNNPVSCIVTIFNIHIYLLRNDGEQTQCHAPELNHGPLNAFKSFLPEVSQFSNKWQLWDSDLNCSSLEPKHCSLSGTLECSSP